MRPSKLSKNYSRCIIERLNIADRIGTFHKVFKKIVRQGRNERKAEAYLAEAYLVGTLRL